MQQTEIRVGAAIGGRVRGGGIGGLQRLLRGLTDLIEGRVGVGVLGFSFQDEADE